MCLTETTKNATLDYLVRFAHVHEGFRIAELQSLADLHNVKLEVVYYSEYSPLAIVRLPHGGDIIEIVSRAILVQHVYELWGTGTTWSDLHTSVKINAIQESTKYIQSSFSFNFDSFRGSRSMSVQREMINDFAWLGFLGPIDLKNPEQRFMIFEEYRDADVLPEPDRSAIKTGAIPMQPTKFYFGRLLGTGARDLIQKYNLKKRNYISTTSMDAEVSLIMANMAHARSGALFFDPFVGTGSLTIACAHFGATVFGSDIDPRTLRGKNGLDLQSNFKQYGTSGRHLDSIISDLVNTPIRGWSSTSKEDSSSHKGEWLDGIICDPPYGVREGLKTLGKRGQQDQTIHYTPSGAPLHLAPDYIAPRKNYSFTAILADILSFAAVTLIPNGRLSFWMPTADDVQETLEIPTHPKLELVSICVQPFNKWSRRLITYRKRQPDSCPPSSLMPTTVEVMGKLDIAETEKMQSIKATGEVAKYQADDLNPFRKRYFQGFRSGGTAAAAAAATAERAETVVASKQRDEKEVVNDEVATE